MPHTRPYQMRMYWLDVVCTILLFAIGLVDVARGGIQLFASEWAAGPNVAGLTPVCNGTVDEVADEHVRLVMVAYGAATLSTGPLLMLLAFYRGIAYQSYLPVDFQFGAAVRAVVVLQVLGAILQIVMTLGLTVGDAQLLGRLPFLIRLGLLALVFVCSFALWQPHELYEEAMLGRAPVDRAVKVTDREARPVPGTVGLRRDRE